MKDREANSEAPSHSDPTLKNGFDGKIKNGNTTMCTNGRGCEVHNRRPTQNIPATESDSDTTTDNVTNIPNVESGVPGRGALLLDPANICTLVGASLAVLAMAAMWKGNFSLGISLNMLATLADILDGPIARSMKQRHPMFSVIGANLDTYSDMVSHFVVPASLLMQISGLDWLYVGLATIWLVTGIIRHSYSEVLDRCDDGECILGVTSDYTVPLCAMALHLVPIVGRNNIAEYVVPTLAACILFMVYGSLTFSLKSRRYSGFGLFTVTLYNISLSVSCILMWFLGSFSIQSPLGLWSFEGCSLLIHLILAYPCYFRFVEINC